MDRLVKKTWGTQLFSLLGLLAGTTDRMSDKAILYYDTDYEAI